MLGLLIFLNFIVCLQSDVDFKQPTLLLSSPCNSKFETCSKPEYILEVLDDLLNSMKCTGDTNPGHILINPKAGALNALPQMFEIERQTVV